MALPSLLTPPPVPVELYVTNRQKLLNSFRQHLSDSSRPLQGIVLLQGGDERTRYDTDHLELFRQESYFAYLFGVIEPGFYGAIGIDTFVTDLNTLHPILTECRVFKSELELALIQFANDISSEAHVQVMRNVKVGMKEYQLESLFLHHTYMYGGCRHCSYTCICATGDNSAVLHYGHAAAPNDRTLEDGDIALFDMGAEYQFYGSDITCSFPVNGKFTSDQSLIYNAVLKAHDAVILVMKPGINWVEMHKLAEKIILESLIEGSVLVGDVMDMMAARLGAVFMPHGLGHFLGIDTHDPGGFLQGLGRPEEPGLSSLRTVRDLKEGMVITVEPGCYFIDALLDPALKNSKTSKFFNVEAVNKFRGSGGVRIESDLLVTANGCRNMTNCPRETWEIEAVMAGSPWPIVSKSISI
ncbi:hypothetical protein CSA_004486 [Cucumis sativus]|uniref:Uncharacterized protein n=1 Tax=Cucumis sativus TaxID=3659 RepID=A0ACB6HC32_CUCSA|nr:hypothetical protein CSA_004486 [Cucumis sativus]